MKVLNILTRCCIPFSEFEDTLLFYENLLNQKARLRIYCPEDELQYAQVASVFIIAGNSDNLAPILDIDATYYVDDIEAYFMHLPILGAEIVEEIKSTSTGRNMLVRHLDGHLIEYVEHTVKHKDDLMYGQVETRKKFRYIK